MDTKKVEEVIAHARKHDLAHLEGRIKALDAALQRITSDGNPGDLLPMIHRPGWTTLAEFALVLTSVEDMIGLANQLTGMKHALLKISGMVGASAPPPREGGPKTTGGGELPDPRP